MKRLCGFLCVVMLCITMLTKQTEAIVYAVASVAFGCLGLTSAEKIFKKPINENKD